MSPIEIALLCLGSFLAGILVTVIYIVAGMRRASNVGPDVSSLDLPQRSDES